MVLLRERPSLGRDLTARARGAVQPDDRTTLGGSELGETDPSSLAYGYGALQLWACDIDHAHSFARDPGHDFDQVPVSGGRWM